MAAPTNHYKLGLFVILGAVAALGAVVVFGARAMRKETVDYMTFFNESVQGLEVGAPVKFRGVTIGVVDKIQIAPDHRMVEVKNQLDVAEIKRMGLSEAGKQRGKTLFSVPPDLRAQLGSQGITGVKFVAIDFFDPKSNPAPDLPFLPPQNYIPAAASLMKNLEDTVAKAMESLPQLVNATVAIMGRVDRMVAVLEDQKVMESTTSAMRHADDVLGDLDKTLRNIDKQKIPEKASATLSDLNKAVAKMDKVLDRIDGDTGLVATAKSSIMQVGELGRSATGSTHELDDTLREIRDAAASIRTLTDSLDRHPDMLIKGRSDIKKASDK